MRSKSARSFGWPEGSVRAILTLVSLSATITTGIMSAWYPEIKNAFQEFVKISALMLGTYIIKK